MGSLMTWLYDALHRGQNQRIARTERLDEIRNITQETVHQTREIKARVKKIQEADDPLAELMETLKRRPH